MTRQVRARVLPGPQSCPYKRPILKASAQIQEMTQKADMRSPALPRLSLKCGGK